MSWWYWGGIPARVMLKLDEVSDTGELLCQTPSGTTHGGHVYRLDHGDNDHLNLIECRWTSPWLDLKEPDIVKQFEDISLDVEDIAGGITVTWSVDQGAASGTFVARKPARYNWGDSSLRKAHVWNNAAGSTVNGMYWVDRKRGEYLYRLPGSAVGRSIQLSFASTSGVAMEQVQFTLSWTPRRQKYAHGEVRK